MSRFGDSLAQSKTLNFFPVLKLCILDNCLVTSWSSSQFEFMLNTSELIIVYSYIVNINKY